MKSNQTRDQRIFNELEDVRQQGHLMVIDCEFDGLMREDFWVLWVKGKSGTLWQGMIIPVEITFPQSYPLAPPKVTFPKQFLHIHIYEGGQICMPILQPQYWKPKSTMVQLIRRIDSLLHQQINPYSPANNTLFTLYKTNTEEYNKVMAEQRGKYLAKDQKYYQMACVHVEFCQG